MDLDEPSITAAIRAAESRTSGEIRVFVSRFACEDALVAGLREFARLGMERTPMRNGLLLFFAPVSGKFAVVGDEAVQLLGGDDFVRQITAAIEPPLRAGRVMEAILAGVCRAGELLAGHFPKSTSDRDDLPNTVARD